jgi:hypothetical protein
VTVKVEEVVVTGALPQVLTETGERRGAEDFY